MSSALQPGARVAFLGLGLIGGSIAKAMRKLPERFHLYAWNPHSDKVQVAIADGVIDEALDALEDERLREMDLILLCAPVQRNRENLRRIAPLLKESATVTDIGSVKRDIHEEAEALGISGQFVGGHPMAGSERTGYLASKGYLLQNAYYVVTAGEGADPERVMMLVELVSSLGAIPIRLDYREHDRVVAAVSHVPHVIAAALVHLVEDSDGRDRVMKRIAAGGFKDITRIASSSPQMWEEICMTNGGNISELLGDYIDQLTRIRREIDARDQGAVGAFFAGARDYRDSFTEASHGPIKKAHILSIDIADEPGVIATVSTLLAVHGINIRNIGISHNREVERGVLCIEVQGRRDEQIARRILGQHGYTVA